jgi:hypothetical protein
MTAESPDWIHKLLCTRPEDVAGARVWDDAVAQIARWSAEHDQDPVALDSGSTPTGSQSADWAALKTRLGQTRVWLAATDRTRTDSPIVASHDELVARLTELDDILATSPADCRQIIAQLQAGQLSFEDTGALLETATDQQAARQAWIIEHWPYVVEYQEINRTLTTGAWGPASTVGQSLRHHDITPTLRTALDTTEPWLQAVVCALATSDSESLDDVHVDLLERIARYRLSHGITGTSPLGSNPPIDDLSTWSALDNDLRQSTNTLDVLTDRPDTIDL